MLTNKSRHKCLSNIRSYCAPANWPIACAINAFISDICGSHCPMWLASSPHFGTDWQITFDLKMISIIQQVISLLIIWNFWSGSRANRLANLWQSQHKMTHISADMCAVYCSYLSKTLCIWIRQSAMILLTVVFFRTCFSKKADVFFFNSRKNFHLRSEQWRIDTVSESHDYGTRYILSHQPEIV